ncbi:MAG: methyltransferase domain-containing protein [Acidobacteriota bacterium]
MTQPPPGPLSPAARDTFVRDLWTASAREYAALAGEIATYRESNRALVEAADLRPGHAVLDLACGGGATLGAAFDAEPGLARAWAVDWSPGMVDEARRRLEAVRPAGVTLKTVVAPAGALAEHVPGVRVDRVLCNGAFWQFDAPRAVLSQIAELLTPEGRLAFTLPGPSNAGRFLEIFHRLGLTRPLRPRPSGPPSTSESPRRPATAPTGPTGPCPTLGDRCTADTVDRVLADAGWRLLDRREAVVELEHDDYIRWLTLPIFRRPEWQGRDPDELREALRDALATTDERPRDVWIVLVAAPA